MSRAIYPHNDLLNASKHLLDEIEKKERDEVKDGITLDCIACVVVVCAASSEALLNTLGYLRLEKWEERANSSMKMKQICNAAGIAFDEQREPFATLKRLRNLRNIVMHCKPEFSDGVDTSQDYSNPLDAEWLPYMTPMVCRESFEAIKDFQRMAFDALRNRWDH